MSKEKDTPKKRVTRSEVGKALRILKFLKPYRWYFILGTVFLLITSGISVAFPLLLGDLFKQPTLEGINEKALFLFGIFFINAVASFMRVNLFAYGTQNGLALLRQTVYTNLIRLPMSFFSERRVGELNSRISADVALLETTFSTTIAEFLRQIIVIIGGLTYLAITSPQLTVVMLASVPVIAIGAVIFGRFIKKLSKKTQDHVAESNTVVEETLQAISTVKAFANEFFEIARYRKITQEVASVAIKAARYRGVFIAYIIFALFGSIVAVIWRGAVLVQQGELAVGDLFSIILLTVMVGASFGGIADQYAQLVKAVGATEHLLDILDDEAEATSTEAPSGYETTVKGNVAFENVSFSYPSRPDITVLDNVSFSAGSGQQIALVGPSGSGKSTTISLLLRFFDPASGSITIDGKPIDALQLSDLRGQLAVVPQDVLLFGGTIRENIEYGKPGASEEEIRSAALKANALEFIEGFPEALETVVGERGVQLSGGQRQRIAIARAVLKDPAILILDEATSSLDSESERLVQEALEKLMQGRTSIVIAHRLSTIRHADKILVLDHGKIAESGTHEELMKNEAGIYHSLSTLQNDQS